MIVPTWNRLTAVALAVSSSLVTLAGPEPAFIQDESIPLLL